MSVRRRKLVAGVSMLAALSLAGGVAAQFTTSTTSAPQNIGTGTMALALDNVSPMVWTDPIENLAAGDSVQRFVDLRNAGSLKMSGITLAQTNTLGDLLTAPADISVAFDACSVAWNTTTGTCPTGAVSVLNSSSVRAWGANLKALNTFEDFGAGEVRHLRVTSTLAASATNAVQAKSGTITYTFGGAQRTGSTPNDTITLPQPGAAVVTPSSTPGTVTGTFADPTNGAAKYSLFWGETGNSAVAPTQVDIPKGATTYSVSGLQPGLSYDLKLVGQLGVQKTETLTQYTAPVPAPTNLKFSSITTTGAKMDWTDNTGGKLGYRVAYTVGSNTKTVDVPAGSTTATLTGLSSAATYNVLVSALVGGVVKSGVSGTFATASAGISYANATWKYNAASWSDFQWLGGTADDGKGNFYLIGGQDNNGNDKSNVLRYNVNSGSWSYPASLPSARYGNTSAADDNGNVYSFGGSGSAYKSATNEVLRYDAAGDKWVSVAPMPSARWNARAVNGGDGFIYVIGGSPNNGSTVAGLSSMDRYDPATNKWTTLATPFATYGASAVLDNTGRIVLVGGANYGANTNVMSYYTPSTGQWSATSNAPAGVYNSGITTDSDNTLYIFGGQGANEGFNGYYGSSFKKTATGSWVSYQSMPGGRAGFGVFKDSQGRAWTFGGTFPRSDRLG